MSTVFTDTVTLYNHYNDSWYRTILEDVQWTEKTERTVDSDGVMHLTPSVTVTVLYRAGYVEPGAYKGEGFTFGLDNLDVVVLGVCDKDITDTYTITDLQEECRAATISAVSDNTQRKLLKHWRVTAV